MTPRYLALTIEGGIATVTLNRPERNNRHVAGPR